MKAIYLPELFESQRELKIEGDHFHHLVKVFRGRVGEKLKLLDGKGRVGKAEIVEIQKRSAILAVCEVESINPPRPFHLAIGVPKKENLEQIFNIAVQVGVTDITLVQSEYSPFRYCPSPRFEKILTSSLIQSNNPWLPRLHPIVDGIGNFLTEAQIARKKVFFLNSKGKSEDNGNGCLENAIFLIGPEGGFSPTEIESLAGFPDSHEIYLEMPILRSATAVAVLAGYRYCSL
jgi:16S rRNA (uracil1498-N3)-methyltransferase